MHYLTAGESHGEKLTIIIDGAPSGVNFSQKDIDFELKRRSIGPGRSDRQNKEINTCKISAGIDNNKTTANPICVEIDNQCSDETGNYFFPRPGHADLNGIIKYNFDDCYNVAQRASARETAARIVAGVLAKNILAELGAEVYAYVCAIGSASMKERPENIFGCLPNQADIAISKIMCPDPKLSQEMLEQIERAKKAGDSLGGKFKVIGVGLLPGIGGYSQGYDRIDSKISAAVLSIPSVKAIEIGSAINQSELVGSATLDQIVKDQQTGQITRSTNYSGGIEGGMTNAMPLVVSGYVKPLSSIKKPVKTINMQSLDEESYICEHRSDVCVVPSAAVVAENEIAFVLANAYLDKFGRDNINDIKYSVDAYKQKIKSLK